MNLLLNNREFFNRLFSTHYSFSRSEINLLKEKLEWGGCVYSFYDQDYMCFYRSKPGIAFNSNIEWDDKLIEIADFNCNHLALTWWEEDQFPLKKKTEIEKFDSAYLSWFPGTFGNEISDYDSLDILDINPVKFKKKIWERNYNNLLLKELIIILNDYPETNIDETEAKILNPDFYARVIYLVFQVTGKIDVHEFYNSLE